MASPADAALEQAKAHLRDSLVAPPPVEAAKGEKNMGPMQGSQIKDTTMGRLEHRLEVVGQQVMAGAVTSYDAWVHGDGLSTSPKSGPPQQHSVALQPRTRI